MATAMVAEQVEAEEQKAPQVPEAPEEEAIRASLSRGDARAAIARCARVYGAALGRFCQALLASASEADEAVQETLLAAYDAATEFRGEGTVRAWLYGIARRICARRLEVRTRQARRRTLMTATSEESEAVDDVVDQARRGATVRAALAELRPTEREALLLRYEGDLSYRDVAAACGIDEAAARQRVSRALAKVRARVSK
ncbi:MAG: RNA polymerase sigma factor [Polyangiales bacterium]